MAYETHTRRRSPTYSTNSNKTEKCCQSLAIIHNCGLDTPFAVMLNDASLTKLRTEQVKAKTNFKRPDLRRDTPISVTA